MGQACTGRLDGECYNIGLMEVIDRPYEDLVAAMRATHRRVQGVYAVATVPSANTATGAVKQTHDLFRPQRPGLGDTSWDDCQK